MLMLRDVNEPVCGGASLGASPQRLQG